MKIDLKDVTLVCVDDGNGDDVEFILEKVAKFATDRIDFGDVKIMTPQTGFNGFQKKFKNSNYTYYNHWVIKELPFLIKTKYFIIFQWDGFIINPDSWDNNWFKYDYIGGGHTLQNGGFSLRNTEKMKTLANEELLSFAKRDKSSEYFWFSNEDSYYSSFFKDTAKNYLLNKTDPDYELKKNWYEEISKRNLFFEYQPFKNDGFYKDPDVDTNKFCSFNYYNPNSFGFHVSTEIGFKNIISIYENLNIFTTDELLKIRNLLMKKSLRKNIVICGDSFSIGIGCHDLKNEPYGALLGKYFDENVLNFSKGSSTNLSIYLQVKYVFENIKNIKFVCIGTTCNNRTEWFPDSSNTNKSLDNFIVNYHQYPPYGVDTYSHIIENPMKIDTRYSGEMFTENYYGIIDYVDNVLTGKRGGGKYFEKFEKERPEKLKLLRDYYAEIFDERIQRIYDMGVIIMSHVLLSSLDIKHIILTNNNELKKFISEKNLCFIDWIKLSNEYPDTLNTLHTSPEGHKIVFNSVLNKIKENGWE